MSSTHPFGILALATILGSVYKAFDALNKTLSTSVKGFITQLLKGHPQSPDPGLRTAVLSELIDRSLGDRLLSIRFFLTSLLVSFLVLLIALSLIPGWLRRPSDIDLPTILGEMILFLAPCAVTNLGAILLSRSTAYRIAAARLGRVLFLLALYTGCVFLLACLAVFVEALVIRLTTSQPLLSAFGIIPDFFRGYGFDRSGNFGPGHMPFFSSSKLPYGIFFYSSLWPAVLLWTFVLGSIVIYGLRRAVPFTFRFFDLDNNPVTAIGLVADGIILIFVGAMLAVR